MVISPNLEQEGKNIVKKLENVTEAIDFFREQRGKCELAVGKDAAHKTMLASMENGKVNYVSKEFRGTFYNKPIGQTFWIDRGKGFNAPQAVNLVQGRAIYRDDLINMSGEPYKAWVTLDIDKGKDRFGNFGLNQYNDPSYGFKLNEVLERFNIRELDDPKKVEKLQESLMNGNRPMVTVEKDGQPHKIFIEAVPRYRSMNMFEENGAPAKREQYMKEANLSQSQFKGKDKENEMATGQGMAM